MGGNSDIKNNWLADVKDAATGMMAGDALSFIKNWSQWIGYPIEVSLQDPYLEDVRQNLLLTAFPILKDELMEYVLQNLTNLFFQENEYQLPASTKIEERISAAGEGLYNEERLKIRKALEESQTLFGGISVKESLERFEKFQNREDTESEDEITNFLLTDKQISEISSKEKEILKNLLEVYGSYLRYPVITMSDLVSSGGESRVQDTIQNVTDVTGEQISLLNALSKFSNLGNQIITENRIKLKNQTEPVRPSVTNWLKVYREELGIRRHNSVERAKFLFESFNGKKLNPEERERIHSIIRSIEDDEPLTIDTKRQVIVFPSQKREETGVTPSRPPEENTASPDIFERFQNVSTPVRSHEELKNVGTQTFSGGQIPPQTKNTEEQALLTRIKNMMVAKPQANAPAPKEEFQEIPMASSGESQEPLGTLRFSAKHVLPAERQSFAQTQVPSKPLVSSPPRLQPVRPNVALPYSSSPSVRNIAPEKQSMQPLSSQNTTPATPPAVERDKQVPAAQEPINMFRIKPSRE